MTVRFSQQTFIFSLLRESAQPGIPLYSSICANMYLSDLLTFYMFVDDGWNPEFRFGVLITGTESHLTICRYIE